MISFPEDNLVSTIQTGLLCEKLLSYTSNISVFVLMLLLPQH